MCSGPTREPNRAAIHAQRSVFTTLHVEGDERICARALPLEQLALWHVQPWPARGEVDSGCCRRPATSTAPRRQALRRPRGRWRWRPSLSTMWRSSRCDPRTPCAPRRSAGSGRSADSGRAFFLFTLVGLRKPQASSKKRFPSAAESNGNVEVRNTGGFDDTLVQGRSDFLTRPNPVQGRAPRPCRVASCCCGG